AREIKNNSICHVHFLQIISMASLLIDQSIPDTTAVTIPVEVVAAAHVVLIRGKEEMQCNCLAKRHIVYFSHNTMM
ncbi:hypothetical protein LJC61_09705, partial [Ruminococcaceae bacterium OttesenSCG-928-A16]|nr:hypothetical protein [Ruminococcaceae bacterium OttesenSCG-928-A16]